MQSTRNGNDRHEITVAETRTLDQDQLEEQLEILQVRLAQMELKYQSLEQETAKLRIVCTKASEWMKSCCQFDARSLNLFACSLAVVLLMDVFFRWREYQFLFTSDICLKTKGGDIQDVYHRSLYGVLSLSFPHSALAVHACFACFTILLFGILCNFCRGPCCLLAYLFHNIINERCREMDSGPDQYMHALLIVAFLLPWRHIDASRGQAVESWACALLKVLNALLYVQVCFNKMFDNSDGGQWWFPEFSGVGYALNTPENPYPLGAALAKLPMACKLFTVLTLAVQLSAPLLLAPSRLVQTLQAAALLGMQVGIQLTIDAYLFQAISIVALVPFIPAEFWNFRDFLDCNAQMFSPFYIKSFRFGLPLRITCPSFTQYQRKSATMNIPSKSTWLEALALFVLTVTSFVFTKEIFDITEIEVLNFKLFIKIQELIYGLGFNCSWGMFSDANGSEAYHMVVVLKNRSFVDLTEIYDFVELRPLPESTVERPSFMKRAVNGKLVCRDNIKPSCINCCRLKRGNWDNLFIGADHRKLKKLSTWLCDRWAKTQGEPAKEVFVFTWGARLGPDFQAERMNYTCSNRARTECHSKPDAIEPPLSDASLTFPGDIAIIATSISTFLGLLAMQKVMRFWKAKEFVAGTPKQI